MTTKPEPTGRTTPPRDSIYAWRMAVAAIRRIRPWLDYQPPIKTAEEFREAYHGKGNATIVWPLENGSRIVFAGGRRDRLKSTM